MRTKVLSVHNMISWSCFQLVKNAIPCVEIHPPEPISNSKPNIKLIHCDGLVKIYHRPVHVSEVMLEFPKHLVCRSDSFYIGQKIPPLAEHELLQLGHKYFLLPKPFFHSVLSFVTIASFFSSSSSASDNGRFLNSAAACRRPFDIQRTPSGGLRIRVSDEFISRLLQQGKVNAQQKEQQSSELTRICNTPQLAKDYTQLVRRTQWKPKLETITERQNRHLLSPFGIKKKKKKPSSHSHLKPPPSPPPPLHHLRPAYKPKSRIKSRD